MKRVPGRETRVAGHESRSATGDPGRGARAPRRREARGFTLLELMAAIMVISTLAAVLLDRLAFYQEMAEKAAMEAQARMIKTGLQVRLAELIITNRQAEAPALETEDPVRWLERPPANYAGVYREPARPGHWYFDATARQLAYVVNSGDRLEIAAPVSPAQVRFQARLLRDRVQAPGGAVESVSGITLARVYPYRWQ